MQTLQRALEYGPKQKCETLVVACGSDPSLDNFIANMKASLAEIPDIREKLVRLANEIAIRLGGSGDNNLSPSIALSCLVYCCEYLHITVCCDALGMECRLVQGDYRSQYGGGYHAWNVVRLYGELKVMDIMHTPGTFHDADEEKVSHYHRLVDHAFGRGSGISVPLPAQQPGHIHPNSIQILKHSDGTDWVLGSGGFGQDTFNVVDFRNEVQIMHSLRHEHIITFKGACLNAEKCFLVTEFAAGGDLLSALQTEPDVMQWRERGLRLALQVARGLCYLHSNCPPVIHRDLKPQNILLTEDLSAKISDFGLSRFSSGVVLEPQQALSLLYSAPEARAGQPGTNKIDIYSFGIILKQIVMQCPPDQFTGESFEPDVPSALQRIIEECLSPVPEDRPSAPRLVSMLEAIVKDHCMPYRKPFDGQVLQQDQPPPLHRDPKHRPAATEPSGHIIDEEADQLLLQELGFSRAEAMTLRSRGVKKYYMLKFVTLEDLKALRLTEMQTAAFLHEQAARWPPKRTDSDAPPSAEKSSKVQRPNDGKLAKQVTPPHEQGSGRSHSRDHAGSLRQFCSFASADIMDYFAEHKTGARYIGLPEKLRVKLADAYSSGWKVTFITLGPDDAWFLQLENDSGSQRTTRQCYSACQSFGDAMKRQSEFTVHFVALGEANSYFIQFKSGAQAWSNLPNNLMDVLKAWWDSNNQ
eukprot:scaffold188477_cov47-Prasinocladus_malaysianus.AAC.1